MKRHRKEQQFLDQLATIPNVSLACEKVGLSRNTVYRWCKEDPQFQTKMDEALDSGTKSINDLAESKLITHINNGNLRAIQYWLDNNKSNYARPRPKTFWDEVLRRDERVEAVQITIAKPKVKKVLQDN